MKIISWNVNGIRAVSKKGFLEWLQVESPDILCLQEIKAKDEQLEEHILNPKGYTLVTHSAKRPGYSGVATYFKSSLKLEIKNGIGKEIFDVEGRFQIIKSKKFTLLNGYYPNGSRDHSRVDYKLDFSNTALKKAKKLLKDTGLPVLMCGDFNTAHTEIDLKNPKTNKKTTGFLPHEREFLDKMIKNGFDDIHRLKNPEKEGHYTWWSYRNNCRERNIGWRIDYFFVNNDFSSKIKRSEILAKVPGSDHCPVLIEF